MLRYGWNEILVRQSSQCPVLIVLDLGLFHGLKTVAHSIAGIGQNVEKCIDKMTKAFNQYGCICLGCCAHPIP